MIRTIIIGFLLLISTLVSQVNTESMRSAEKRDGFQNKFNLEFGYEKSNSEVFELAAKYRLDYIKQNNFHSFIIINFNNGYEKEDDATNIITNKGFIHFRTTRNLIKDYQVEVFTQYEFNEFLLLNDRYLIGSGLRIGLQEDEPINTYLGMGFMYEKETYNTDIMHEKILIRSTNYIKNNLALTSNIDLSNTAYFQIATDDSNDYRILYDGGLEFYANDSFAFTISWNYRYDSDPHGDLGNGYVQISNGMSFNF